MSDRKKLSALSLGTMAVLILLVGFGLFQYVQQKTDIGDEEFGTRVRAYLMSNPQVLREVIQELTNQEQAAAANERADLIASLADDLKHDPTSFVAGNPDGDITIVEFFDYRCGYCKKSFPDLMKTVEEDGNIRLVLKEFPVLGDQSVIAARAAIASIKQGKYLEFHKAMMETRGGLTLARVFDVAKDVGLDVTKLEADMKSEAIEAVIAKNYGLARKLGINGTPAFVIEEEFAPGAISAEQMKMLVTSAREKSALPATN